MDRVARHPAHRRTRRRRAVPILLLAACGLAAVACGPAAATREVASIDAPPGSEPPTTTAASTDPEEAMRQFAACMREHGVDVPDPEPGGKGVVIAAKADAGSRPDPTALQAADKECRHFMDGVAQDAKAHMDPAEEAKMKDQALAFAKCMREHGVDMPDPQFGDGSTFQVQVGGGPDDGGGVDPSSPAFQDAQKACGSMMPGSGPDGAGGGFTVNGAGPGSGPAGGQADSGAVSVSPAEPGK